MKTLRYILLSVAVAGMASACSDDLNPDGPANKAEKGDEVRFSLSLPGADTRTVYGEENTETNSFPIYWVDGDLVKVASPQCMSGRNNAEYSISVDSETQNYATSMTKTGDAGVQWGDAETADFYSIYPSTSGTALNINGTTVTAALTVAASQFASITDNGTSIYAQPADMGNVVMYAKTTASKTDEAVELHYTPFSTVIEFEITAPDTYTGSQKSEITIQALTLTAPTGTTIAGDFTFNFPASDSDAPSVEAATTGGSNAITIHFLDNNKYTTVLSTTKQTLKAKMCVMPISGVDNLNDWKVEVATSAGTFSKTLKESDFANEDGSTKNTALAAGQVHKVKLPQLNYASEEWKYELANWIPSLPDYRNIYLSEISLPGAWYAGSSESYQATSDIATLWNAGVRAFAVECRTNSTNNSWHWTPNYVCISGSGRNTTLGDAYTSGTNITTVIGSIKTALEAHPNEYAVLVLSYADGGSGGHRDEDHAYFLQGIADAISVYSDIIYESEITANTTVNDVLGKLIIKVNVDNLIPIGNYTGMNALISYNPFLSQMTDADYSKPYYSNLYWSSWADNYKSYDLVSNLQAASGNEDKFVWVFSSANRTQADTGTNTTIPTYAQRQSALGAMMKYSKQIYDASTHNVWFYFNCGGTQATSSTSSEPSPTSFATTMNDWLLNTAIAGKTDASPLGIVMFNQCTSDTYNGPAIIKAIIEMNSKFYLKHAGTAGGSTGGTVDNTAQNDGTVQSGGDAI
ncbi:MAG: hypothetical protein ACI4A8_09050 [Muribaculaceae bacterium]